MDPARRSNSGSDNDDEQQEARTTYVIPALLVQQQLHQTPRTARRRHTVQAPGIVDDESNHCFLSEPSVSEDGDASSGNLVRAPHRMLTTGRVPSSSDDDERPEPEGVSGTARRRRGGNGGARRQAVPNSPGNTSLSSWDAGSPAATKHFLFQFLPERVGSGGGTTTTTARRRARQQQQRATGSLPTASSCDGDNSNTKPQAGIFHAAAAVFGSPLVAPRSLRHARDNATHAADGGVSQRTTTRLRPRNHGTYPTADESGPLPLVPSSAYAPSHLQHPGGERWVHVKDGSEDDQAGIEEPTHDPLPPEYVLSPGSSTTRGASKGKQLTPQPRTDESIAMTLSEDSDQGGAGPNDDDDGDDGQAGTSNTFRMLLQQWEAQNHSADHSADDEQTDDLRPPRAKRRATAALPGHKRTRSGDAAAATLATGGSWRGMELDQIPLPRPVEEDEEEEDDSAPARRSGRLGRPPKHPSAAIGHFEEQSFARETPWVDQHEASVLKINSQAGYRTGSYGSNEYRSFWRPANDVAGYGGQAQWSPVSYQPLNAGAWGSLPWQPTMANIQTSPSEDTFVRVGCKDNELGSSSDQVDGSEGGSSHEFIGPAALEELERTLEQRQGFRSIFGSAYAPPPESPLANMAKKSADKLPRRVFLPQTVVLDDNNNKYRFYTCPRCGTRQREFFTVSSAPNQDSGPSSYLALYFALYVTASLFIFGLEEGWEPLDCIYFAVITLTTTGLGDKVPTTAGSKVICSIFIYFGVACIGLLLGTYIAGLLDDKASRDRMSKRMESCQTCKQVQCLRESSARRSNYSRSLRSSVDFEKPKIKRFNSERNTGLSHDYGTVSNTAGGHRSKKDSLSRSTPSDDVALPSSYVITLRDNSSEPFFTYELPADASMKPNSTSFGTPPNGSKVQRSPLSHSHSSGSPQSQSILSPVTRRILGRQGHTRHQSIDLTQTSAFGTTTVASTAGYHRQVTTPLDPRAQRSAIEGRLESSLSSDNRLNRSSESVPGAKQKNSFNRSFSGYYTDVSDDSSSDGSTSTDSTVLDIMDDNTFRMKAAKYVFITLRQALVNSLVIIAIGSFGFWYIEGFSFIDCWYFSTVLLTTTGYGDIIPTSRGGKLFATIYLLVAGTILLNNMSLISMIPLELRRRRIERAVLTQFGDQLDDAALRELATGPLVQRLHLSANRPDGLDECTREMFSLAMLVRLGKVTEDDIKETFAAFRRLDVNNEGVLNSKSIIAALIQQKRSKHELRFQPSSLPHQVPPPPPPPAPPLPSTAPILVPFPATAPPQPSTVPPISDQQAEHQRLLPSNDWNSPRYMRFDPASNLFLPFSNSNGDASSVHYSSGSSRSRKQGLPKT